MLLSRNSRLRLELQQRQGALRGTRRPRLGAEGGRGARASLLEAQGDLIVRRDSEGRITYANDAYCALAGAPREALIGAHRDAAGAASRADQRAAGRHARRTTRRS